MENAHVAEEGRWESNSRHTAPTPTGTAIIPAGYATFPTETALSHEAATAGRAPPPANIGTPGLSRPAIQVTQSAPAFTPIQQIQKHASTPQPQRQQYPTFSVPGSAPAALDCAVSGLHRTAPGSGQSLQVAGDGPRLGMSSSDYRRRSASTGSLASSRTYNRGDPIRFRQPVAADGSPTPGSTPQSSPGTPSLRPGFLHRPNSGSTVARIDSQVRDRLRHPRPIRSSESTGYVYVAYSLDRPNLVKIGSTDKESVVRERALSYSCGLVFERFGTTPFRFKNYKRAESLVHLELSHFRYNGPCNCRAKHREWFELDEATAHRVVERWRLFVSQDPWTETNQLTPFWKKKLDHLHQPTEDESHVDHHARDRRWNGYTEPSLWEVYWFTIASRRRYIEFMAGNIWSYWCALAPWSLFLIVPGHLWHAILVVSALTGIAVLRESHKFGKE